MKDTLARIFRVLSCRPSYMLLTASDADLADQPPARFARAWLGVLTLSLAWGVAMAGLWSGVWLAFGDLYAGLPLIPALSIVIAMTLWLYRIAALSLADALVGQANRALGTSVIVVSLLVATIDYRGWGGIPSGLPVWLQWLTPYPQLRVMVLAPVWGAWAMLVTCRFRRPSADTAPAVTALADGAGPIVTTLSMGAMMAATIWWLQFPSWTVVLIPAVTVIVAVVGGLLLCRKAGGLTRQALLANNLLTQLAFWFAYVACL